MLTVLSASKLVVNLRLVEGLEALGANEAPLVEDLAVGVDYLLFELEALVAMGTNERPRERRGRSIECHGFV